MRTICSPSTLKINVNEWEDKEIQTDFIEHLFALFECISDYHMPKVVLTDEMYSSFWCGEPLPPWISNKDFKNSMVPVLYRNFMKYIDRIDNLLTQTECSIDVGDELHYNSYEDERYFLILLHHLLLSDEQIYLYPSIFEKNIEMKGVCSYFCDCHKRESVAKIISNKLRWIKELDIIKYYWPEDSDDICRLLKIGLTICIKRDSDDLDKEALMNFDIHPSFIKDTAGLLDEDKKRIIKTLSKRLRLTLFEAMSDKGLHDELVNGERRIRVSGASRIHYRFENGKMLFTHYYSGSRHDVGLR